jgi:TolA-binding protein
MSRRTFVCITAVIFALKSPSTRQSQTKDVSEQISRIQFDRGMEKECHAQLEDELNKWKQQVDSFKKKAQEQIRMEREMLEHEISACGSKRTHSRSNSSLKGANYRNRGDKQEKRKVGNATVKGRRGMTELPVTRNRYRS